MQVSWTAAHIHCSFDLWQLETEKPQLHVLVRGSPPHFLPAVAEWVSQRPGKSSSLSNWGRKMHLRAALYLGRSRLLPLESLQPHYECGDAEARGLFARGRTVALSWQHVAHSKRARGGRQVRRALMPAWWGCAWALWHRVTWEIVLSARVRPQRGL